MGLAGIKGSHRGTEDTEGIIGGIDGIFHAESQRARRNFFGLPENLARRARRHGDFFLTA